MDLFGFEQTSPTYDPDLTSSLLGRAAEFLVCFVLAELGYVAHHVDTTGYDLILETDEGLKRVQVKARQKDRLTSRSFRLNRQVCTDAGRISKKLDTGDCDLVALVALDLRRVVFDVPGQATIRITDHTFHRPNIERMSLEAALLRSNDAQTV